MGYIYELNNSLSILTGMDDEDEEITSLEQALDDSMRVNYFKEYLASVAHAIRLTDLEA